HFFAQRRGLGAQLLQQRVRCVTAAAAEVAIQCLVQPYVFGAHADTLAELAAVGSRMREGVFCILRERPHAGEGEAPPGLKSGARSTGTLTLLVHMYKGCTREWLASGSLPPGECRDRGVLSAQPSFWPGRRGCPARKSCAGRRRPPSRCKISIRRAL